MARSTSIASLAGTLFVSNDVADFPEDALCSIEAICNHSLPHLLQRTFRSPSPSSLKAMEKWVSQFGQTMIMVELGVKFTCKNYSLELVH